MTASLKTIVLVLGQTVLFGVSIFLHLICVWGILHWLTPTLQTAPTPQLIEDSIELVIAETESETPIDTPTVPPANPLTAPLIPDAATYLTHENGTLALPLPTLENTPPDLTLPDLPQPLLPPVDRSDMPSNLPEITLPPAEETTPAQGATARFEKPKLKTNIHTYLRKNYPKEARRNGWEGVVTLHLQIAEDGSVTRATIAHSSGYVLLDEAARKMMLKARYTSGPAELSQRIEYRLK